ncbi:efflux transporter outer membrane subunit [Suttonella ornithocola]|uniref:Probable efflux pump outer membrane protein ttgC n=1 Tax=Suttonella ornithocola TaxID=279832 RepID=A0A380N0F4_9GAMM|nr:efflux transporter outer membrane subunit [Suttonella ornithocola]SUO97401.1 Probable efflux pump outer membrane protein ttgC precursor [Suttonella ornithocola]
MRILFICASLVTLSACSNFSIPNAEKNLSQSIDLPKQWIMAPYQTAEKSHQQWWRSFNSQALNQLMTQALTDNQNLQALIENWRQAKLSLDQQTLAQTPTFSGNIGTNYHQNFSDNQHQTSHSAGLSASYQLDLWQKLKASTQTQIWNANASAEDWLSAKLSLEGEIANAYFTLLYANEQLKLNAQQQSYQEKIYQLTIIKHQTGAASQLDINNAKQSLSNIQNSRISLEANAKKAQFILTTLLGQAPTAYLSHETLNQISLVNIPAGLPANLLHQRPDLRAKMYRLQASLGNITIAERDFYPTISLTGGINTSSEQLSQLLRNPIGTIAASISLPFLQQREKQLALKTSQSQYQSALADYRQTLYNALRDVETALISLQESELTAEQLQLQHQAANNIVYLTEERYRAGADSLQTLLEAQNSRRNIENALLDTRYQRLIKRVALYLALGGGTHSSDFSDTLIIPQ